MARLSRDAVALLPRDEAQAYFTGWAADLKAKLLLIDTAEDIYQGPGDTPLNAAVASLIHASYYLNDRVGYEMAPHPKGMILLPALDDAPLPDDFTVCALCLADERDCTCRM